MFWRSAILGGLVWLALGAAVGLNGEETTAESNDSNPQATDKQMSNGKDVIEIPLSEIWALDMPGTRDVEELEPELKASLERIKALPPEKMEEQAMQVFETSLVWQIRKSLRPGSRKKAGPGFAVSSPNPELLKAVRDVLTGEKKRVDSFPAGSDITAVFFVRSAQTVVHVYRVERRANVFEIHYRFVPREDSYVSEYLALIPLGKLPSATYQVNVVQGPMEQKYVDAGYEHATPLRAARFVSRSFKFEVQE